MSQMSLFQPEAWTVSELTRLVRQTLEEEASLQEIWVAGEVSNLSHPRSGHLYFTLKDAEASLRCVMWRPAVLRLQAIPQPGEAVEVHGSIGVYEAGGQYQLYADRLRPTGAGRLYLQFLELKDRLEAEGLFDSDRKRSLPAWPRRIGVITSPTGAALQDILNTLRRRFPLPEVILAPSLVQGPEAPPGIVAAFQTLNRLANLDVVLLVRGGGSLEDLWAFNDERVVRAVAGSAAPVISGVGHETDFTLADFAADLRAPTPTAAAELATPDRQELLSVLGELVGRLDRAGEEMLQHLQLDLAYLQGRLARQSPLSRIQGGRQRLDDLARRASASLRHHLGVRQARLQGQAQRLNALNPQAVLERGYAVVSHPDGRIIRRVVQVQRGDVLTVQVSDGGFEARVQDQDLSPGVE